MGLILIGGIIGEIAGNRMSRQMRETLMLANAVSVLFIGIGGVIQKMLAVEAGGLKTQGTMMIIMSMALGAVAGELLDIDRGMISLGEWLKKKTRSEGDASFVDAFVTASLTVSIGAMAVVGAIEDGIRGDCSVLIAKGVLDFIIIAVMTSSLGRGAIFSFVPVGILQGTIYFLARVISPLVTPASMDNLSCVGSMLIFCVGLNLIWPNKIRVANLLPAIFIAAAWSFW